MWHYNPSVGTYYNHITYGKTNYTHKHSCIYVLMCICVNVYLCVIHHIYTYVLMCVYTYENILGFIGNQPKI